MIDHTRSIMRLLQRLVANRQPVYFELFAIRAQQHPDLAEHLMTACEALETAFSDDEVAEEPRPQLPTAGQ
ncbi:MAG: hypothetical protein P8Q48_18415 [Paracoccaceae bacterium]|nr:hypothetical protein [Paracoccaceae bacterium]MDG1372177.1 hypothetical protein [Paracoccaceae bacterium]